MSRLSRRTFLAMAGAGIASPALAALPASGETDVVIVGAGAAGIAAARRVAAAGKRYVLLEASDRIGGRCQTDNAIFGAPYDLGAHWITGPEQNPVAKLASRAGVDLYPAPPDQRIRIGRRYAREGEMEDFLTAYARSQRALADAALGRVDVSAADALPKDLGDWRATVEFMLGPYRYATDLAECSALDLTRSQKGGEDAFCRQGFGTLLARLADGLAVELATPATQINFMRNLEVETPRGRIGAGAVIITASIGVLLAGRVKFNPDLPRRPLDAIGKLKLGQYERIALEIVGDPLGLQSDTVVLEKSETIRTAAMLANVHGTSLAYIDVAGRFARELAAGGERAMLGFALDWLGGLYGTDMKKAVKRSHATRWGAGPWTLGAISSANVGGQPSRRILMEPVRERIFFAGEAVHETLFGTVAGAWESGERAADAALKRLAGPLPAEEPKRPPPRRSAPARQRPSAR